MAGGDIRYVTGGTLALDASSYIERAADRDIYDTLAAGEYCYVLNSRQMGKSSLCVRTIARLREAGVRTAFVDLTRIGAHNASPEQWYAGLMAETGRELDLRPEFLQFRRDHGELPPVQRYFEALREVALPENDRPLVVFIDEIDAIRSLPFSADEFFAAIRACYNARTDDPLFCRLTFCLVGTATPSSLISDTRISPFNIGRRIELRDFTPEEAAPLANGLIHHRGTENAEKDDGRRTTDDGGRVGANNSEDSVTSKEPPPAPSYSPSPSDQGTNKPGRSVVPSKAQHAPAYSPLRRVLYWTGGHPYLTQRLCQALAANPKSKIQNPKSVDSVCSDLFLSHSGKEGDDNLAFVRNRLLRSEVDIAGLLDLLRVVRAGKRVPDDDANPLSAVLKLSGVCREEAGALRIRNRIYERVFDERWVREQMPDAELQRQRQAYRRGVLRTAAVSGSILAVMGLLAGYAMISARQAASARDMAVNATTRAKTAEQAAKSAEKTAKDREADAIQSARDARIAADRARTAAAGETAAKQLAQLRQREALASAASASKSAGQAHEALRREQEAAAARAGLNYALGVIGGMEAYGGQKTAAMEDFVGMMRASGRAHQSFEWGYLRRLTDLAAARISTHRPPTSIDLRMDPPRVLVGGTDRTEEISLASPARTRRTKQYPGGSACWTPDGRIVRCGRDNRLEILSGTRSRIVPLPARVLCASVCSDNRRVAAGLDDGSVRVVDLATGETTAPIAAGRERGTARSVRFCCGNRSLVAAYGNPGIGEAYVRTAELSAPFRRTDIVVRGNAFVNSADLRFDGFGAAAAWDGKIYLFREDSGKVLLELPGHAGEASWVQFSPDGALLYSAGFDGTIRTWEVDGGKQLSVIAAHPRSILRASLLPERSLIATVDTAGEVRIHSLDPPVFSVLRHHKSFVSCLSSSPDGRMFATGDGSGQLTVWESASLRPAWSRQLQGAAIIHYAPGGKWLLAMGEEGEIFRLDAATGSVLATMKGRPEKTIWATAVSPDGARVCAGQRYGREVCLWDAATGQKISSRFIYDNGLTSLAFSPDGRWIVGGFGDGSVRRWQASMNSGTQSMRVGATTTLTVEPSIEMGRKGASPAHGDIVRRIAFSRDGKLMATASFDQNVILWDVARWSVRSVLRGHLGLVDSVDFSPDNRRLLSAGFDKTVRVWDVQTGRALLELDGHRGFINTAIFSGDGSRILAGGALDDNADLAKPALSSGSGGGAADNEMRRYPVIIWYSDTGVGPPPPGDPRFIAGTRTPRVFADSTSAADNAPVKALRGGERRVIIADRPRPSHR